MAEKKSKTKSDSTKKASKQAKPKAVDMVSPTTPADETGLELTEERVLEPVVGFDGVSEDEPMVDFQEDKNIEPKQSVVEEEVCEKEDHDDHEQDACMQEQNQELETPEPMFKGDKEMVNDITNILNGIDGVKASKLDPDVEEEIEIEDTRKVSGKNTTNTEEKNYYSEQFSRNWGGVMYDY